MSSKLGIHVNFATWVKRMKEFVRIARPAIVKVLNLGDVDFAAYVADVVPQALLIGRKFFGKQRFSSPEADADEAASRILGSSAVREGVVKIVEGYNEIGPHPTHDYMRFELRLAQRLHEAGIKYVAGSWSVGCPAIADWESTWILEVLRVADYIGVHEYCAPMMNDPRGMDAANPGQGWFTLRYRKWYPYLPPECQKPLLITECAIDSGAAHWDPGAQGGWRSFTDALGYLGQLAWYDQELRKDPYVAAAAIYCWGTLDPKWDSFDLSGEMADLLQGYLVDQQTEGEPVWIDMRNKLPRHETNQFKCRPLSDITTIVLHHTAAPASVGPTRIAEIHVRDNNWPGIGYHFCVGAEGETYWVNDLKTIGAHVKYQNEHTIGVALLGCFTEDAEPTRAQIRATKTVLAALQAQLGPLEVVGHKDIAATRCPGDKWHEWRGRLLAEPKPAPHEWEAEARRLQSLLYRIKGLADQA